LLLGAAALGGCTAGEITTPDGGSPGNYTTSKLTFIAVDAGASPPTYVVNTMQNGDGGAVTFSYDPYAPSSSTNGPFIPPGDYNVILLECPYFPSGSCIGYFSRHQPVNVGYGTNCNDAYTGQSVPCSLFHFVLCPPESWAQPAICTSVATNGSLTTVPLFPGP
jgi:hypothetical protein